jgi:outer membrane protein
VTLNVRQAFFNARAQKDLVHVAKDTLENQERHLKQIQGFVKVGARPDIDLAQARADRANAEVQLINASNAYANAKAQLNQAMGIEARLDYDVNDESFHPVEGEALTIDTLMSEALRARPEVAQIAEQLHAQERTIDAALGGWFPALAAQAGLTDQGPGLGNLVWNWNVQIVLSWNVFQGFLTQQTVREARAGYDAIEAQVESLRLSIRLELEQAFLAVQAAKAAFVASHEALTNAKERLRLAESRYAIGVGNVIELGDAQVALTAAAGQEVGASYSVAIARAQLVKALGRR